MDDFSESNRNWDIWEKSDESAVSFFEDGLIMIVSKPNLDIITTNKTPYKDVLIKTTGQKRLGTNDNAYGIVCRYLDSKNYYGFLISSDGYYGIVKVVEGEYKLLSSENMEFDESIRQGKGKNNITAKCEGNTLTLSINGIKKTSVIDNDLVTGKTGLITGSFSEAEETAVLFDNFIVTAP
ncbi:MAG: hypothetical protein J7K66_01970 [Anaerolineaceae bacterium]|nr:hypothetical protein [Anaerolineaceae bacterium]